MINTAGDVVQALSCFSLFASLLYLAWKYRVKRLSAVFLVFSFMFAAFGLRATCAAVLWWHEAGWVATAALVTRSVAALLVAACAVVTARCADAAFRMLKELAVLEKRLAATVEHRRAALKQDEEGRELREVVTSLRSLAREALSMAPPAGAEGP